jgi:hypothetical protein
MVWLRLDWLDWKEPIDGDVAASRWATVTEFNRLVRQVNLEVIP